MTSTLFYPAALQAPQVMTLMLDTASARVDPVDLVSLPDGGGAVDWELAVPYLAGMDEVVIKAARVVVRGHAVSTQSMGWSHTRRDSGHLIALEQPARLVSLVIDAPDPADETDLHLVVRPAQPDGGGWSIGPPAFATPSFSAGPLFPDVLGGMTGTHVAGGRLRLSFPSIAGQAWLVLWASGAQPTDLTPQNLDTTVRAVTVELLASDVTLTLRDDPTLTGPAAAEVMLWSSPGPLTPEAGAQRIDLAPMSGKRLNDRLRAADPASPPPTLSLPLRFSSSSGGALAVDERVLDVRYRRSVTADGPIEASLAGDWAEVPLPAPAALRPESGRWALTARHRGRELNGPPPQLPTSGEGGLVVTEQRWAAVPFTIGPGPEAGGSVQVVAVTLRLSGDDGGEAVVQLHRDAADRPGPALGSPAVGVVPTEPDGALDLDLPNAVTLAEGERVWLALRSNRGAMHWRGAVDRTVSDAPRLTTDRGVTWSTCEQRLGPLATPTARLFHRVERPAPPILRMRAGAVQLPDLALTRSGPDPLELALVGPIPSALLDAFGGAGRSEGALAVHLACTAALDLTVAEMVLTYLPSAGPTGG